MEFIKNYIAVCTGFIFIASVSQTLLPDGSMKNTLRMVLGIILSLLLISPFWHANFQNVDIFPGADEYTIYSSRIKEMEQFRQNQVKEIFQSRVAGMVQEFLKSHGVNQEVAVEVMADEQNRLQRIVIHKNLPALRAKLAGQLGISEEQIQMTE